jgi:hypothetical protein
MTDRPASRKVEWWLDASAFPELFWARLTAYEDGSAQVFDLNGRHHPFDSVEKARLWLAEDEYESLDGLIREGTLDSSVAPPSGLTDRDLLPQMVGRLPDSES